MKKTLGLAALAALIASPAFAHHPLAGAEMTTFTHGVLSGIGHPILGFDHLFFVIAVGIVAAMTGRLLSAPLGYIAGMLGGIALITNGVSLPYVEFVIAGSLILLGGLAASGRAMSAPMAMALFAGAGLFHGWAFGQTITGQEAGMGAAVLAGYLLGLVAVQYVISVAAGWLATRGIESAADLKPRLAGAVVAGVGVTFFLEGAETAAFAALGLS
jgi:urease accessory protein